ncbi:helix-turn-helix domain-containing protein [Streptomyces sp. NBC_01190]|uniref:helix-turn-helix domain-containing protein n=1 Tax=Streptomyces sp. NBC_01190 TaxID=2903767 RepID=UPI00386E4132|nr:helix-turn-helix domain-containing protein [Streptomyces sp. NBC_01190]
MTTRTLDPSVNRNKLGRALRAARKSADLTQREAAESLVWSLSKVIRIENGLVSVSVTDLRAMIQLYGIEAPDARAELEEAARGSRGVNWWTDYYDVLSTQFSQYLGWETAADTISLYHPIVIPGQLQTEAYARALLAPRDVPADRVVRLAALRAARQRRLFDPEHGPEVSVVLDEASLRRWVGGPEVMADQLRSIVELSRHPRVAISVLPLSAGAHYSTGGNFVLLGLPGDGDLLWVETTAGILTSRHDLKLLESYQRCFAEISARALTGAKAIELISAIESGIRGR